MIMAITLTEMNSGTSGTHSYFFIKEVEKLLLGAARSFLV